jgi:hypothetical protein
MSSAAFAVLLFVAIAAAPAPAAEVTIGADVNGHPGFQGQGTCAYTSPADRPCVIITTKLPGRMLTAPCDGTVVRWRMNGIPSADTYAVRVVHRNTDGSYTGTSTSAPVSITVDGVNPPYPTSLPIKQGDYVGIDFQNSSVDMKLRWVYSMGLYEELIFRPFPANNTVGASPQFVDQSTYLFNADIACAEPSAGAKCKTKKKKKHKSVAAAAKKKKKGCKKRKKKK